MRVQVSGDVVRRNPRMLQYYLEPFGTVQASLMHPPFH